MFRIKAIVFDLDGVLIEAKDWHYEALNRALKLFGYQISRYDHVVTFDGLPTRKKLEMLSRERQLPAKLHPFINELKQQYTLEVIRQRCKPVFQHEFALSRLKRAGYRLAVASNSIRRSVDAMMELSHLGEYVDVTFSNNDVSSPKPAPDIYIRAAEALDCAAPECLVVEDNAHGIRAAESAGCAVMVVESTLDVTFHNVIAAIARAEAVAA